MRTAIVVLLAFVVFGVSGCNKYQEKIVGVWEWKVGGGTLIVTVNKDGSGSLEGPAGKKTITWRIQRFNNFVFNMDGKDAGFLIDNATETTIEGNDPAAPGQKILWTRKNPNEKKSDEKKK